MRRLSLFVLALIMSFKCVALAADSAMELASPVGSGVAYASQSASSVSASRYDDGEANVEHVLVFRASLPDNVTKFTISLVSSDGTYNKVIKEYTDFSGGYYLSESVVFDKPTEGTYHFAFDCVADSESGTPDWTLDALSVVERQVIPESEFDEAVLLPQTDEQADVKVTTSDRHLKSDVVSVNAPREPYYNNMGDLTNEPGSMEDDDSAKSVSPVRDENSILEEGDDVAGVSDSVDVVTAEDSDTLTVVDSLKESAQVQKCDTVHAVSTPVKKGKRFPFDTLIIWLYLIACPLLGYLWKVFRRHQKEGNVLQKKILELMEEMVYAKRELADLKESRLVAVVKKKPEVVEKVVYDVKQCDRNLQVYLFELSEMTSRNRDILSMLQDLVDDSGSNFTRRKKLLDAKNDFQHFVDDSAVKDLTAKFTEIHPQFASVMLNKYPQLTSSDIYIIMCLYLGATSKDIANLTGKELRSVESSRNRLRKKLELETAVDLRESITSIYTS